MSLICPLIGDKNCGADLCSQRRARHVSGACGKFMRPAHAGCAPRRLNLLLLDGEALFGLNTPLVSRAMSGLNSAGLNLEGASRAACADAFAGVPRYELSHLNTHTHTHTPPTHTHTHTPPPPPPPSPSPLALHDVALAACALGATPWWQPTVVHSSGGIIALLDSRTHWPRHTG